VYFASGLSLTEGLVGTTREKYGVVNYLFPPPVINALPPTATLLLLLHHFLLLLLLLLLFLLLLSLFSLLLCKWLI
jgi:hypothetical protein